MQFWEKKNSMDIEGQKLVFDALEQRIGFPADAPLESVDQMLEIVEQVGPLIVKREQASQRRLIERGAHPAFIDGGMSREHIVLSGTERALLSIKKQEQ
jgi:hypothetical protein